MKAFNDRILDGFTIHTIGNDKPIGAGKLIKGTDEILLKIKQGFGAVLKKSKQLGERFNLVFVPNRHTFQQQHNALQWFKDHQLFDKLCNETSYALSHSLGDSGENVKSTDQYTFRYQHYSAL